jgi:hypothetical protein
MKKAKPTRSADDFMFTLNETDRLFQFEIDHEGQVWLMLFKPKEGPGWPERVRVSPQTLLELRDTIASMVNAIPRRTVDDE